MTDASKVVDGVNVGTAGAPSSDVVTVQGVTNGTVLPVSAASLPLPTGAATSANQTTSNSSLSSIDGKLTSGVPVTGSFWQATQPVSASALPLPTGAATSALQTNGNSSLSTIATNTPAVGQAAMAASSPVVIASNQSTLPASANAATLPASTTMQTAAVANGNGTNLSVAGHAIAVISIVSSPSMSGGTTVNFEASLDGTTNFIAIAGHQMGVSGALTTTTTADGDFRLAVAGYSVVRARISGYSAGTVTIKGYASPTASHGTAIALAASSNIIGKVGADSATGSTVPANAYYKGLIAKTALPAAASDANLVGAMGDKYGRQVTISGAPRDLVTSQRTTITSSTSETTIVTATASEFHDVSAFVFTNTSATVTRVDIRDTTAGTVIMDFDVPPTDSRGITFNVTLPQTTVNTNWTATCGTSVADLRVTVVYIKNK